jgi:superfamily I DNA and/or RNA helicase
VQTRKVGFLNIPNRLNVALTRARYQLILLGHQRFFLRQERSDLLRKLAEAHATPDVSLPRRAV